MTRKPILILVALMAASLLSNTAIAKEAPKPAFSMITGVSWAYAPATKTGLPLRLSLSAPMAIPLGKGVGLVLELGGSSSFTAFDLSPYALTGLSGKAGPIRLGGSLLYSYTPPWSGEGAGSHLIGASFVPAIPIIPKRLTLLLPIGPRHVIGSGTAAIGGAVLFVITPPAS